MTHFSRCLTIVLACTFAVLIPRPVLSEGTNKIKVAKLTNAELIKEYELSGLALIGTTMEPSDLSFNCSPLFDIKRTVAGARWVAVEAEILKRGSTVVPELILFLEQEAPKSRKKSKNGRILSFTGNTLRLLEKIGDPRGAPIALRILEGWDGKVDKREQACALFAIERITRFRFRKVTPHRDTYADSVEHADAIADQPFRSNKAIAKLYGQWMEGEGRDSSKWAELASRRAHQILSSKDLEKVYCAASFLAFAEGRDDAPDATLARLAEIIKGMKKGTKKYRYTFEGKPVPVNCGNWMQFFVAYGPRARPYSASLIRIQKEWGMNSWSGYAALRKVGGPEIVSFLIDVLPKVSAKAERIKSETPPGTGFASDDPRGWWLDSQREVRLGIDRWAGRLFDTDADRLAWWKANKMKPPQEWLRLNLRTLVEQVDRNVLRARWIACEILPDLPKNPPKEASIPHALFLPPGNKAFCATWLNEHHKDLHYDQNAGCFRLKQER